MNRWIDELAGSGGHLNSVEIYEKEICVALRLFEQL